MQSEASQEAVGADSATTAEVPQVPPSASCLAFCGGQEANMTVCVPVSLPLPSCLSRLQAHVCSRICLLPVASHLYM